MQMKCKVHLWSSAIVLLCLTSASEVSASLRAREMSFEEVATQATVIVLGRVDEIPNMAVYDSKTRDVYRRNRVHVEQYLKGSGPTPEIEVITLGGLFDTDGLEVDGPRIQSMEYGTAAQLPPIGTEVLLFLRPYPGGEAFMIYTAYHGVAPVQEGENGQERFVYLGFRDPDFVSPETAARYSEMYPGGFADLGLIISDRVAVSALKETLGRVLNRKRKPPQR